MCASGAPALPVSTTEPAGRTVRVMVVDDALVIRGLISRMIDAAPGMEVAVSVNNGQKAIDALKDHEIDVVILDIEMPVMDGLTALPRIIEAAPGIQVLMASTLTLRNAEISLRAMELGAADYIPKPSSGGEIRSGEDFQRDLIAKVRSLGHAARRQRRALRVRTTPAAARPLPPKPASPPPSLRETKAFKPDVIAIASSTGGPQALATVLRKLPASVRQPILITQHMPATFTRILAEHLGKIAGRPCAEAVDGEPVQAGSIYIAPGDHHMVVERKDRLVLHLNQDPPENFCRPAADPMLRSLVAACGRNLLAVVLTGMGSDGKKGCEAVVAAGGQVIAQDEDTSVVWGMPGAVSKAGLCSAILPAQDIGAYLGRVAAGLPGGGR